MRLLASSTAILGLLTLTACASDEQSGASTTKPGGVPSMLDSDAYSAAVEAAKDAAGGEKFGGSLEIIGYLGGPEVDIIKGVYKPFTDATGTQINYTGTQDLDKIVQSRVQADNPPDVVDLFPGAGRYYASQGKLLDLSEVIGDDELRSRFGDSLTDVASLDGKAFGVYTQLNAFSVWFNPQVYAGPTEDATFADVQDYTEGRATDGDPTWCMAQDAGAATGVVGSQFIETIFAKKYGPDMTTKWGAGQLPYSSPEVRDAFETFGELAADENIVGGRSGALAAPIGTGYRGIIEDPPSCELEMWGSWIPGLIGPDAKPMDNIDFFQIPNFGNEYDNTEVFHATVHSAFTDKPETKAFMKYLASDEAQALFASANYWPSASKNVDVNTYKSPVIKKIVETYITADDVTLTSGPDVLNNSAEAAAFWKGVVKYLQNPGSLDEILADIDASIQADQ